ncbi:uncharacterized protein LOC114524103 [Dendronephthya gigantea]|uniref:uncharacterized protein LOC114524103 n=1 Tax=Dendronephthya gigantea TaxID=151771 RepID=UPI001068ECDD|nr:uncharacterized protein LOC114524103 [Dendronephthya gigantea]
MDLNKSEEEVVNFFKEAVNKKDLAVQSDLLKKLAQIYVMKFDADKDVTNLKNSAALCQASIVRDKSGNHHKELKAIVENVEEKMLMHMLQGNDPKCDENRDDSLSSSLASRLEITKGSHIQEQNSTNKRKLQAIREWASSQCKNIMETSWKIPEEEDVFQKLDREVLFIQQTKALYVEIEVKMRSFISHLIRQCQDVLGKPSGEYAFLGLGSFARAEITPWSDLEFVILIRNDDDGTKRYFRNLTHLLHLKVINFGETLLPAMGIKSLNDFSEGGDDWFFDDITPSGLKFDGAMPWASKLPTGRGATSTKPAVELICTPKQMASFQEPAEAKTHGYHLADMLVTPSLLYGSPTLMQEYFKEVKEILQRRAHEASDLIHMISEVYKSHLFERCPDTVTEAHVRFIDALKYDNGRYLTFPMSRYKTKFSSKKDVYRFPSATIDNFRLLGEIKSQNSWEFIEANFNQFVIIEAALLLSISVMLRLTVYSIQGCQVEDTTTLGLLSDDAWLSQQRRIVVFNPIAVDRFYELLSNFMSKNTGILLGSSKSLSAYKPTEKEPLGRVQKLLDCNKTEEGLQLAREIMDTHGWSYVPDSAHADRYDDIVKAFLHNKEYDRVQTMCSCLLSFDELPNLYRVVFMVYLAQSYMSLGNIDIAVTVAKQALEVATEKGPQRSFERVLCLDVLGGMYFLQRKPEDAVRTLQSGLEMIDYMEKHIVEINHEVRAAGVQWTGHWEEHELYDENFDQRFAYKDRDAIAGLDMEMSNVLSTVFLQMERFDEALTYAEAALKRFEKTFGNLAHPRKSNCLINLSQISMRQGNLVMAKKYIDDAKENLDSMMPTSATMQQLLMTEGLRATIYRMLGLSPQ